MAHRLRTRSSKSGRSTTRALICKSAIKKAPAVSTQIFRASVALRRDQTVSIAFAQSNRCRIRHGRRRTFTLWSESRGAIRGQRSFTSKGNPGNPRDRIYRLIGEAKAQEAVTADFMPVK